MTENYPVSQRFAVAVVLSALTASLLLSWTLGRFQTPDRWEDSVMAANILAGHGSVYSYLGAEYHFYGSALYPRLLAAVLWLTGSEATMLSLQAVLFAGLCLLIVMLSKEAFGPTVAWITAALVVLHPGSLIYTGRLHSQTLDTLLIALTFGLISRVRLFSAPWIALGTGLVAGLAVASRGTILPFCVIWGLWFVAGTERAARALRVVALVGLGGLLVVAPIFWSGYTRYGRLIPLRTDTGVNLWTGMHHGATGTSYTNTVPPRPAMNDRPPDLIIGLQSLNEVEQHDRFTAAAVTFVRTHPGEAASLVARKFWYFWTLSPHTGLEYPASWRTPAVLYASAVVVLALKGTIARRTAPLTSLWVLLAGSVSLTQAGFHVDGRHRAAIEPILLIFTATGLQAVWTGLRYSSRLTRRRSPR